MTSSVSRYELGLVKDVIKIHRSGEQTLYMRRDIALDPAPFIKLLARDEPGATYRPNKGRFVIKRISSDIGDLVSKRFHYRRTYRRKQRWFMGWCWQRAHGPQQFIRSLYAHRRGHRVVEPVLALRRPTGWLRQESLLVTRRVEGVSLRDFFLDPDRPIGAKLDLFQRGLGALKAMHEDGIAFGDAQSRHQLLDGEGRLWWLDFDKMAIRGAGLAGRDRDLRRFTSSALLRISQSGYDVEEAFGAVMEGLDKAYPLPGLWRRVLLFEVGRRVKRMQKRPGFHRL